MHGIFRPLMLGAATFLMGKKLMSGLELQLSNSNYSIFAHINKHPKER